MNRKPKLAKEVPIGMQPNDQERKRDWRQREGKKKETASNEVLSEIHNAVCTALKDFSRVGVFLYGPQQKCGQGWVGGGWASERGSWLWGLPYWDNCANNSSLTSRAAPDPTAEKCVSQSPLSEPAVSASLRTKDWVPQLRGCWLHLDFIILDWNL